MKKVSVFLMLLLCMLVALDHSVYADEANSSLTIDGVNVGEVGKAQFYPNYDYSAENFLKEFWWMTSDERNSEDAYFSVEARSENATFTLLESVIYTGAHECKYVSSGSCYQPHEIYRIRVVIDDLILTESFTFEMHVFEDRYINEIRLIDHRGPIYYEYIDDMLWVSSNKEEWALKTSIKPDGKLLVTVINSSINSSQNSTTLNPWNIEHWDDSSCGYTYEGEAVFDFAIYPDDGYIMMLQGNKFYPEGLEQMLNTVKSTSGNIVGNSSSNLYGGFYGGKVAVEEDMIIWTSGDYVKGYKLQRGRLNKDSKDESYHIDELYVIDSYKYDPYRSINIVDGNIFFANRDYVFGYTINGDQFFRAAGDEIVANTQYAFYTDRTGYGEGLMRYTIKTGEIEKIWNGEPEMVCIDGDWLYWIVRNLSSGTEKIKRMPVNGGQVQTLISGRNADAFMVDKGILLYWTNKNEYDGYKDATDLYMLDTNDANAVSVYVASRSEFSNTSSATFGSDDLPYMMFHNGWIYYYYSEDNSIICRRNLDGSIVDKFVCYSNSSIEPFYIFDNELFIGNDHLVTLD